MKIDTYSFGKIIINGKLYTSDVIIEVPAADDLEYASPALVPASAPDGYRAKLKQRNYAPDLL